MIRDPIDIKNSNVWQNANKTNEIQLNPAKRTLIILGEEGSGKTSFIKLIKGDFDLQAKPTRLIDFYTVKKQGLQIEMYEISSPKFQKALQFLITPQNCMNLMIVLCLDLTKANNLIKKISEKIETIRQMCQQIISNKAIDQIKQYNQQRRKKFHLIESNQDIDIIKRMPFQFSIIGCKHDLFQKMKPDEKKWISRCLRYLAHTNEANLLFSSTKNMQTGAELRLVFTEELFGVRKKSNSNQKDQNKAIFILTGQDKVGQMNLPAFNNSGAFNEVKILEQQMESVFPLQKKIELKEEEIKQFKSIGLDSLINKYNKQLTGLMKEKEMKIMTMTSYNVIRSTKDWTGTK